MAILVDENDAVAMERAGHGMQAFENQDQIVREHTEAMARRFAHLWSERPQQWLPSRPSGVAALPLRLGRVLDIRRRASCPRHQSFQGGGNMPYPS